MRALAMLVAVVMSTLVGCVDASPAWGSSTTLSSAVVLASELDDAQITSIARRIQADQRVLAELALRHGDDVAVRELGSRFLQDGSPVDGDPPSVRPRPSALEDDLAQQDVTTALGLARYAGRSFDRAFVRAERDSLEADIEVIGRVLAPMATDPTLRESLDQLEALLSDELEALEAMVPSGASR